MTELCRVRIRDEFWRLVRATLDGEDEERTWVESISARSLERGLCWAYACDVAPEVAALAPNLALTLTVNQYVEATRMTAEIAIVVRNAPNVHRLAARLRKLWSERGRWPCRVEGALLIIPVPASLAQAARDEIDRVLASE